MPTADDAGPGGGRVGCRLTHGPCPCGEGGPPWDVYDADDPAYRPLGPARDCREAAWLALREPRRLARLLRAGAVPRVRAVAWIPDLGFEVEVGAVPRRPRHAGRR